MINSPVLDGLIEDLALIEGSLGLATGSFKSRLPLRSSTVILFSCLFKQFVNSLKLISHCVPKKSICYFTFS